MCNIGRQIGKKRVSKRNPLVGYRWFAVQKSVKSGEVTLRPLTRQSKTWESKVAKSNRKPTMRNPYGLYGFSTKVNALNDPAGALQNYVLGRITAWGDCVLASRGFRAEFAKIDLLYPTKYNRVEDKKTVRIRAYVSPLYGLHSIPGSIEHRGLGTFKSLKKLLRANKNLPKVRFAKLNLSRTGHNPTNFDLRSR